MAKWFAGVAELADALDLGSSVPDVQVQVLSPAVVVKSRILLRIRLFCCIFLSHGTALYNFT